jgi:hypothetical protein
MLIKYFILINEKEKKLYMKIVITGPNIPKLAHTFCAGDTYIQGAKILFQCNKFGGS